MKRTALVRKTPLARGKPLAQGAPLKRKKPMAKKRPKRSNADRDPIYLGFIRRQPCMVKGCREPSQAHHYGKHGMGQKCSDYECCPLCQDHHTYFHQHSHLPGMTREETKAAFAELGEALRGRFASDFAGGGK